MKSTRIVLLPTPPSPPRKQGGIGVSPRSRGDKRGVAVLILLLALSLSARSETVALALSGGGSRGFAHIGVLKALEEEKLDPDLIVGTSMGAVVGGLYAAGYTANDLQSMATSTDWGSLFLDRPARRNLFLGKKETVSRHILSLRFRGWVPEVPLALTSGQRLTEQIFNLVQRAPYHPWPSFDDLRIPFRALATDLVSGQPVIFSRGDLAEAIRASISLPLVFTPYALDSLLLVDGGVIENIPVEAARSQGADVVVAVDVSSGLASDRFDMPWELADRVTTVMQRERNAESRAKADVLIEPEVGPHPSTDFSDIPQLIEAGYRAAQEHMAELRAAFARSSHSHHTAVFCSSALYTRLLEQATPGSLPPLRYDFVGVKQVPDSALLRLPAGYQGLAKLAHVRRSYMDMGYTLAHAVNLDLSSDRTLHSRWEEGRIRRLTVTGLRRYPPSVVLREFPLGKGDLFNERRARRGISAIYGSDLFETVSLSVLPSDSGASLTFRVQERPSPQIRLGAGYSLERRGRAFIEVLNDNVLDLGGRLELFGKYGERDEEARAVLAFDRIPVFGPLDRALQGFSTTELRTAWKREEYNFYTPDHRDTSFYFFERRISELWVGRSLRRWGALTGGLLYEDVREGGALVEPTAHITKLALRSVIDTKDSYPFPSSGIGLNLRYEYALRSVVAGRPFNRVVGLTDMYAPLTHRWVLHGRGDYAWNDRILPPWGQFQLGGEESLLGLHVAERYGNCRLAFLGELRYDLISRWLADAYVSGIYTVGAVSHKSDPVPASEDYQHGVGVSLSLSTFLGPIRFTVGELLRSKFGREDTRLYFDLGHEF
jgi:predicted acylesterase/phospholipase RssA